MRFDNNKIKFDRFLYDYYYDVYSYITKDKKEIETIWSFDRQLSTFLLSYILMTEQMLKSLFVEVVTTKFPSINEDFKKYGISKIPKKYKSFSKVDREVFLKAVTIANSYGVRRIDFQVLVHNISFRAFITMLLQVSTDIRDSIISQISKEFCLLCDITLFEKFLLTILKVRNVSAHNGQLFSQQVSHYIKSSMGGSHNKFIVMLEAFLKDTGILSSMIEGYTTVLKDFNEINSKYHLWV